MSNMQGLIFYPSSLSPFIFLITDKESPSIFTIGKFTNKPSSTACKHATTSAAKEVAKLVCLHYVLTEPSTMFPQQ
uniref:Uncharacterized protein n=1 Tax=Gossypium raimondii TaxID=29730 RepID=A0A0D2RI14_GOSRA|nr:hypothetical protein B456_005G191900 [Gossypium raimondii]